MMVEGWAVVGKEEDLNDLQKVPPSLHPNRIECVTIAAINRYGKKMRVYKLGMGKKLIAMDSKENADQQVSGWFTELLSEPLPKSLQKELRKKLENSGFKAETISEH